MTGTSRDILAKRLVDFGLMSPEDVHAVLASLPDDCDPSEELISQQILTDFQASALESGELASLVLGNYIIQKRLGKGGMGVVYLARHRVMKRDVAVKVLSQSLIRDRDAVQRFQREVQLLSRLEHPHIAIAHDAAEERGVSYLVMEYLQGSNLRMLVRRDGPLSIWMALHYIRQAAIGMAYAHRKGVIHRDIKPSNLVVDEDHNLKILDLGLARLMPFAYRDDDLTDPDLTDAGAMMGTSAYMAPEQADDTTQADSRSDIYSLGCSLHYLLTAQVLFTADSTSERVEAHRTRPPRPLSEFRSDIPDELEAVFQKMVAKSPDDRYQTMDKVVHALTAVMQHLPDAESEAAPPRVFLDEGRPRSKPAFPVRPEVSTVLSTPRSGAGIWNWLTVAAILALSVVTTLFAIPTEKRTPRLASVTASSQRPEFSQLLSEIPSLKPEQYWVNSLATTLDEQGLVIGGGSKTGDEFPVLLRSLENGEIQRQFDGPRSWVNAIQITPDGQRLVAATGGSWKVEDGQRVGGNDCSVFVWDVHSGKPVCRFREHNAPVHGLALLPDGEFAITAGIDPQIRMWSILTGQTIRTFENPLAETYSLDVSPDGKLFASGHYKMVCVGNLESGEWIAQIPARKAMAVRFSPDGSLLAFGDETRVIHLYSPQGERRGQLAGHDDRINCLAWFPDGRHLISGSNDRSVRTWDVPHGRPIDRLDGHAGAIRSVAVSTDGHRAFSGGADGVIRIWQLSSQHFD